MLAVLSARGNRLEQRIEFGCCWTREEHACKRPGAHACRPALVPGASTHTRPYSCPSTTGCPAAAAADALLLPLAGSAAYRPRPARPLPGPRRHLPVGLPLTSIHARQKLGGIRKQPCVLLSSPYWFKASCQTCCLSKAYHARQGTGEHTVCASKATSTSLPFARMACLLLKALYTRVYHLCAQQLPRRAYPGLPLPLYVSDGCMPRPRQSSLIRALVSFSD